MANTKSSIKRIRQSEEARLRNRQQKSTVRTSIRKFQEDVKSKDKVAAEASFRNMVKLMDTAARKGIFSLKSVARKKSRMAKLLNGMNAA